jgi:hypothetical protein
MYHEEFEKNIELQNEKLFEKKLMIGMNKNDESINVNIENNIVDLNINKNIEKILNKKNILISLPLDVSRFFLNNWIKIENIGFLDKSFCNKKFRKDF